MDTKCQGHCKAGRAGKRQTLSGQSVQMGGVYAEVSHILGSLLQVRPSVLPSRGGPGPHLAGRAGVAGVIYLLISLSGDKGAGAEAAELGRQARASWGGGRDADGR